MNLRALFAALAAASALGACATAPEPCTTEWVDYKTDRILKRFASDNRMLVSDLRQLTRADGEIDPVQAILLAAKADELRRFADSFQNQVVPDLRAAIAECRSDPGFVPAFTEFLRREGVPEPTLAWVGPVLALSQAIDAQQ
ncbi:MAG: hypothetical protein IPK75_02195 [Acidobacteria bacterium]|jgi:hypothetical protein|nr:hypothetical protein [Acidobacteriota bacterium]